MSAAGAVTLDFEICQSSDCSALTFVETTGVYNATTNPVGWGAPNELTSNATAATLTVTLASGNSYVINLWDVFPTDVATLEYLITNEDIGYTTGSPIDDQIISFLYTVTTATATYTQSFDQAFYCQVQCCVLGMFANLNVECDSCSKQIDDALKAYAMLKGLIYSAYCGNSTAFNNILAQVNKLCLNKNCQNCK